MKKLLLLLLFIPCAANAEIGIQTNLLGYSIYPMKVPQHYSIEAGIEMKMLKKWVFKTSFYYLNATDTENTNGQAFPWNSNYHDHLMKCGLRLSFKHYTTKKNNEDELPSGYFVTWYDDIMIGKRNTTNYLKHPMETKNVNGLYVSIGLATGYTFKIGNVTIEPNIGIGMSYVSQSLIADLGGLNLDYINQSLSTSHLQLNIGYRF